MKKTKRIDIDALCDEYGLNQNESKVVHRNKFAPTTHTIISGQTGSGKTRFLMDMLLNDLRYNKILLLTAHPDEKYYKALQHALEPIEEELDAKILDVYSSLDEFKDLGDMAYEDDTHIIVVIDDMCHNKDLSKIEEWFIRSRKVNCQCFYLTQSFYRGTPKIVRENAGCFIIFPNGMNHNNRSLVRRDIMPELDKRQFNNLLKHIDKYDNIIVDNMSDPKYKYRKNLNKPIDINKL